jgi:hypothetical protein
MKGKLMKKTLMVLASVAILTSFVIAAPRTGASVSDKGTLQISAQSDQAELYGEGCCKKKEEGCKKDKQGCKKDQEGCCKKKEEGCKKDKQGCDKEDGDKAGCPKKEGGCKKDNGGGCGKKADSQK